VATTATFWFAETNRTRGVAAMHDRARLPNRRRAESFGLTVDGLRYVATVGYDEAGAIAEIFLAGHKPATATDASARDSAIAASLALQHGCPVEVLRAALGRDDEGRPLTPLGAALALADETSPPPAPG
jgi:hypothetical protein